MVNNTVLYSNGDVCHTVSRIQYIQQLTCIFEGVERSLEPPIIDDYHFQLS